MIILLLGVPGVGKTHLGKYLQESANCKYRPSGETKLKMLEELCIKKHLSELNQTESTLINTLYFDQLDKDYFTCYIVDTHASYCLPDGTFVDLLPPTFKADGVILLEANSKDIANRRIARGRAKDSVSLPMIRKELEVEQAYATSYVKKWYMPSLVINNSGDHWQYSVVEQFIQRMRGNA